MSDLNVSAEKIDVKPADRDDSISNNVDICGNSFKITDIFTKEQIEILVADAAKERAMHIVEKKLNNKSDAFPNSIIDTILFETAKQFSDKLLADESLRAQFDERMIEIAKEEINREKTDDNDGDYYETFRYQVTQKLISVAEEYIVNNKNLFIGYMKDGFRSMAEKAGSKFGMDYLTKHFSDTLETLVPGSVEKRDEDTITSSDEKVASTEKPIGLLKIRIAAQNVRSAPNTEFGTIYVLDKNSIVDIYKFSKCNGKGCHLWAKIGFCPKNVPNNHMGILCKKNPHYSGYLSKDYVTGYIAVDSKYNEVIDLHE